MKKEKLELMRLQTMIESDRINVSENFNELIINDVSKIFSDYFDYKGRPTLDIVKKGDKLRVVVSVTATRVRSFGVIAKQ